MRSLAGSATRHLSSARLELASTRRLRTGLYALVVVALLALSVVLALRHYTEGGMPLPRLSEFQARNAALETQLASLRAELAMERATRSSLDQQVASLNERIAELRSQIDFLDAQRGRPRAPQ